MLQLQNCLWTGELTLLTQFALYLFKYCLGYSFIGSLLHPCFLVWFHSSVRNRVVFPPPIPNYWLSTNALCCSPKGQLGCPPSCTIKSLLTISPPSKERGRAITQEFLKSEKKKGKHTLRFKILKLIFEVTSSQTQLQVDQMDRGTLPACLPPRKGQSNCKYYPHFWEHLNGNTQAITFLSRSLNTNQTRTLIGQPMSLMVGRVA